MSPRLSLSEQRQLESLMKAVSPRFGIIKGYMRSLVSPGESQVSVVTAIQGDSTRLGGMSLYSSGAAIHANEALAPALAESMERYAWGFANGLIRLRDRSAEELFAEGRTCLMPADCPLYSEVQYAQPGFGLKPFSPSIRLNWVPARYLHDGTEVWVPSDLVYSPKPTIAETNSTGIGSGPSPAWAQLSGLMELIERDLFCHAWWTKAGLRRLDLDSLPPDFREELRSALGSMWDHIEVGVGWMDLGVPVFVGTFLGNSESSPRFTVAASASLSPRYGLRKALVELASCVFFLKTQKRKGFRSFREDRFDAEIRDFVDSTHYYALNGSADHRRMLVSDTRQISFGEIPDLSKGSRMDDLAFLTKLLLERGMPPISVDMTTVDLAACGQSVCKMIVPSLIYLNAGHAYRHWGNPRLYAGGVPDERSLNPLPHPFP